MNVLLIDNLDSFTFNLVESLKRLGARVRVVRNTVAAEQALGEAQAAGATLMLSPGPGAPTDAGCTSAAYSSFAAWLSRRDWMMRNTV